MVLATSSCQSHQRFLIGYRFCKKSQDRLPNQQSVHSFVQAANLQAQAQLTSISKTQTSQNEHKRSKTKVKMKLTQMLLLELLLVLPLQMLLHASECIPMSPWAQGVPIARGT